MDTCTDCNEEFPDGLVNAAFLNGDSRRLCGVCGLAAIRKLHGRPSYMFAGTEAARIYHATKAIKDERRKAKGHR